MNVCLETNLYFVTPRTHETSSGIKSRQEEDFIVLSTFNESLNWRMMINSLFQEFDDY